MRKHMTQSEYLKILKLLRSGVTDVAEIQKSVFVHAQVIQKTIDVYDKQQAAAEEGAEAEEVEPVKKPRKPRRKPAAAAADPVDPLS